MLACLTDPPPAAPVPSEAGVLPVLLADRARLLRVLRDVDAVQAEVDALRAELVAMLRGVEERIRAERGRERAEGA